MYTSIRLLVLSGGVEFLESLGRKPVAQADGARNYYDVIANHNLGVSYQTKPSAFSTPPPASAVTLIKAIKSLAWREASPYRLSVELREAAGYSERITMSERTVSKKVYKVHTAVAATKKENEILNWDCYTVTAPDA